MTVTLKTCYLVHGEDPSLVSLRLSALLGEVTNEIGDGAVEEYGSILEDSLDLGPVLDALATPPFLTTHRVVVVRAAEQLSADQARALAAVIETRPASTVIVVAWTGRSVPSALAKAASATGDVIAADPPNATRARQEWFAERVRSSQLRIDARALRVIEDHIGQDVSRLEGILDTLEVTFGDSVTVRADDVVPFIGSAGSVTPWALTDAIDSGDTPAALRALERILASGERHPLQVVASLHRHFGAMLRLDGAEIGSPEEAASLSGLKGYPAKKALDQGRRLGHERVARAIDLLSAADLDLRGRIGWPTNLVLEVLIARLAQLARSSARAGARQRGTARRR